MRNQTEHAWMVFFGQQKPIIPDSKNVKFINKIQFAPEKINGRSLSTKSQKKILKDHIHAALNKNISPNTAIFEYIIDIEERTGESILLRTKKGDLMAVSTFNDIVGEVRNRDRPKIPNKRERIIELFNSGKTELQIRELVDCRFAHIHRCLVAAGLKMKKKSPTRQSNHNRKY